MTKLNRLATPYIFPGQQLHVPVRDVPQNDNEETPTCVGAGFDETHHDDLPLEEKGKLTLLETHNLLLLLIFCY